MVFLTVVSDAYLTVVSDVYLTVVSDAYLSVWVSDGLSGCPH